MEENHGTIEENIEHWKKTMETLKIIMEKLKKKKPWKIYEHHGNINENHAKLDKHHGTNHETRGKIDEQCE
jgi:hypothetical protein